MQVLLKYNQQLLLVFTLCLCLLDFKAQGTLVLYSTKEEIRYMNITRTKQLGLGHAIIKNLTDGAAIDYHYQMQKVCWANNNPDILSIQCAGFNSTHISDMVEIISTGIRSPDGLACDWLTSKLYWTDSSLKGIEVASMIDFHRKVLYWTDIDQPRAIALDPLAGLIFWTDWGELPKIERAGMNGNHSSRKVIVTDNIYWPNGLTLDLETHHIYWIDGKMLFLKRMDYEGENSLVLIKSGLQYPFALTQYQNRFFWTDWKDWAIWMYDRNGAGRAQKKLLLRSDAVPMDIHIWDKSKQPYKSHPCEKNNGNCSHLCLLSPVEPFFTCDCPIGIKLINSTTCANESQELLVFARKTEIGIIYLDSEDFSERILNLTNIVYSIAIDYDPIDKYVYWTDTNVKKIQRAKLDGSEQSDILSYEIESSDGIAIDWVARNIYWTESELDRIEVATLDGQYRKVIISDGLLDPRGIAVAPSLGWLFWSDWNDKNRKIERSNLDGSERITILSQNLSWVNGIALDVEKNRIYWCDAKNDAIEFADMDGKNRMVLTQDNIPHPFGFSILGNYLYWTDWQKRTISRINKDTGGDRQIIVDQISNIMGIKAINGSSALTAKSSWNPCADNNGGCEQICLYLHNKTYTCACQIGYERRSDGRSCTKPSYYLLYTKKNGVNYLGIENPNNEVQLPLVGVKYASSLDLDFNDMRIYWSDTKQRSIMSAYVNGSDPRKVIDLGLASPQGIAVDWVAMNIYWADPVLHRIEVSRLSGTSRRVLLHSVLEPHSIALDPQDGFMYWTEWAPSERSDRGNSIKKAAMDGSNIVMLTTTNGYATTLVFYERRLYWVVTTTTNNASPGIYTSDLNGLDKRAIISENLNRPIGLSIYKDLIIWSDEIKDGECIISKANKNTGLDRSVIHTTSNVPTDLLIVSNDVGNHKKIINKCSHNNGDCPNLCLALPAQPGFTCACPTHYSLSNNTCKPPKKFLAYSYKNLVVRLLPDTTEYLEAVLPIQGLKGVKAIDFDPSLQFLYWIEGKSHSIKRAKAVDVHINVVVEGSDLINPYDIAVDSLGRTLFWSCTIENVINMTRLDNSSNISVIVKDDAEKPRLLAVHSTRRLLIYTDASDPPKIISRNVDGTNKKVLVTEKSPIVAMAIDIENDWLVWTQGNTIYKMNMDRGDVSNVFIDERSKINHIAVHAGWLYWIDKEDLQKIELTSMSTEIRKHTTILDRVSDISDLVSVIEPDGSHPCAHMYCSHLCIMSSGPDTNVSKAVCACPPDSILQSDKTKCATKADCGPEHFTCNGQEPKSKDCIPRSWRCDGQWDCSDGSDEYECPACKPQQFRCHNGECIDEKFYCDLHPHCKDKSDEAYCCKPDQFKCPKSQVCISRMALCDGYENCADGSDETKAVCNSLTSPSNDGLKGISAVFLWIITSVLLLILMLVLYFYAKKIYTTPEHMDQAEDPLNPDQAHAQVKTQKHRNKNLGIPDVVHMSMLKASPACSYDRGHITGASSSTNGSSSMAGYPRETLNPPPSPATTAASTRTSSPSARFRPYKHYRSINQPPPPTPCSTDVCDESDYNYPTIRNRYDGGSFPPPPTPRSHCNSESCPPSPSSRSSTYFSPLPPPPSPVASPMRNLD